MVEQNRSPILRFSQKEFNEMIARGDAQVVPLEKKAITDLLVRETEAWEIFLGEKLKEPIPKPPEELFRTMEKAEEIGWSQAEIHYLPKIEFKQDVMFPGWVVKPEDSYWRYIEVGSIAKNAATLDGVWIIIDGARKPMFSRRQFYENDAFAKLLKRFRRRGKIHIPSWAFDIPRESRFVISPHELQNRVCPAIANLLGVNRKQVRLPRAIEFNVLGNLYHPEWGTSDTREWFNDKYGDERYLCGGSSERGGLEDVFQDRPRTPNAKVGFRPLIIFPF